MHIQYGLRKDNSDSIPIYRPDTNGISKKIFEPLVVNFVIIFMLISSIKNLCDPQELKSSKTSLVANTILGAGEKWAPL